MKKLFLILICAIPFSIIGMDAPQELLSSSESHYKKRYVGYKPLYTLLSVQDFGRLVQVNKAFLGEIISYIAGTKFDGLGETAARSLYYSKDSGSDAGVDIGIIDISRDENVFHVKQERLVEYWIRSILAPAFLRAKKNIIAEDKIAQKLNNYIIFKPSNGNSSMIGLEDDNKHPAEPFNLLMTIYSIDHADPLNKIELDTVINKDIKIPLCVVLEKAFFKNKDEKTIHMLADHFKKNKRTNGDDFSLCGSCILTYFDLFS